jgi:hypothetical protein
MAAWFRLPAPWAWVLLCLFAAASAARADDTYYMMIFSAQGPFNRPKYSHTFAVFVRAPCTGASALEYHTISWMPADLDVQVARRCPQAGRNLDLAATLAWAAASRDRVSMWGPFQVRKELYDRALAQVAALQSGRVAYKALDWGCRPGIAVDCIRAVSDIDMGPGMLATAIAHGDRASYLVLMHLQRWIIEPCTTRPWVATRLGLDRCAVVRRMWLWRAVLLRYRSPA